MNYNIDTVLNFITTRQNDNGSFSTHELYPVVKPDGDWLILPDSSPFITANILCSLLSLNNPVLKPVIEKGCSFLLSGMEYRGYWRFWPIMARQHPIPLDMDDTSVASYVLEQAGAGLKNKDVLAANCNSNGYFYTWLIPTASNFISHPFTTLYFLKACVQGLPTRIIKFYSYRDKEPAVAANVLLYLGENEQTSAGIKALIEDVKKEDFRLQFYHDEIMVYYHISRAYRAGVKSLGQLKDVIGKRLVKRLHTETEKPDELLLLMAAIVLLDFDMETATAQRLVDWVANGGMYPDKWKTLPYFSSENRNFMAGSPEFVAAVFLEAAEKLTRKAIAA